MDAQAVRRFYMLSVESRSNKRVSPTVADIDRESKSKDLPQLSIDTLLCIQIDRTVAEAIKSA